MLGLSLLITDRSLWQVGGFPSLSHHVGRRTDGTDDEPDATSPCTRGHNPTRFLGQDHHNPPPKSSFNSTHCTFQVLTVPWRVWEPTWAVSRQTTGFAVYLLRSTVHCGTEKAMKSDIEASRWLLDRRVSRSCDLEDRTANTFTRSHATRQFRGRIEQPCLFSLRCKLLVEPTCNGKHGLSSSVEGRTPS